PRRNIRVTDISCRGIPQEDYSLKLLGDYPTQTASGNPLAVWWVMTLFFWPSRLKRKSHEPSLSLSPLLAMITANASQDEISFVT
ncbi:MAG: hypothetical protein QM537_06545, partial [Candidatus Symbiobacter sp.]|nr:hypothetical protein [Candidatus Symbiobacter sp.]